MNILGERVKELRKEAGLTQIELGEKLGVDRNTIRRWENNENPPSEENLLLLSRCFDVSMYYLLGITDEKKMEMLTDEDDARSSPEPLGFRHIALKVNNIEETVKDLGCSIQTDWVGEKYFFITDPDGNKVELHE